jgi:hypothetical protein
MKRLLLFSSFFAALLFVAVPAWADGTTDPLMIPGSGSLGGCGSTPVSPGESFTIVVNINGSSNMGPDGGDCFLNTGDTPQTSLAVTGDLPASLITSDGNPCGDPNPNYEFTSGQSLFVDASCAFTPTTNGGGVLTVTFFGTNADHPGIAADGDFWMDLSGWLGVSSFTGSIAAPEPGSLTLLGLGLLGLLIGQKRLGIRRV